MGIFIRAGAAVILAGLVIFLATREKSPTGDPSPPAAALPSPNAVRIDPAEVFRRAFWQPPGAGDKVLQAERREWSDAEGVSRWQWFLVVEPSPELVKYLRTDNAFGIRPEEFDVAQAPHGNMRLFFHKTRPLLHATSSGTGFRPGVTSPTQAKPSTTRPQTTSGRLPLQSPPKK
jgi:hypothetical protein